MILRDHPHQNHHRDTFSDVCQGQVGPLELFAAGVPQPPSLLANYICPILEGEIFS